MAPRWLKIGLCWPQDAQNGSQKTSQVPKDEPKMAARWPPNRYVLASWSFFCDLLPDLRFPIFLCFAGAWKASIFVNFWNKFRSFFESFLVSCVVYAQGVSRHYHDCCRMAYLSLSGPNMDPSWLQVGSSWAHAGPELAPTWLKLVPCWTKIRVPSRT